jgi:DNA-binding NarL/FixJ family response regulator
VSNVLDTDSPSNQANLALAHRPDDKHGASHQTVGIASDGDEALVHVSLISKPGAFTDMVAAVLQRIDPRCRVDRREQAEGDAAGRTEPALNLIDVDGTEDGGRALIESARRRQRRGTIVAMSSSLEHDAIDRALEAGATGYLPKTYTDPLIEGVLRLVIGGEGYRPEGRRSPLAPRGRPPPRLASGERRVENEYGLTAREVEVLAQIAHGCSNLEIGNRLGMQEATVKRHAYNIFGKLNVNNRAAAALVGARLSEVQRAQMKEAEQGHLNLGWLHPEMSHRRMRAGQTIFRAGDVGNTLYTLQRGSVRLPEIGTTVQPGEVFGEIGIFTPEHKRTCSAVCETDVDLFLLTSDQVKRIYFASPQFAFFILHLVATRLMADRQRGRI